MKYKIKQRYHKYLNKKAGMSYLEMSVLIIAVFSFAFLTAPEASAQQVNFCCEKTDYGAWCQNALEDTCDVNFRKTPTSCEATSFCKPGCCYDSSEGLCMEKTPLRICDDQEGSWYDSEECEIPQCELGCCILDHQAAFVTLVRCKKLSGFYGLQTDFRTNINSEPECIALAQAKDRGACVFEEDFIKTCEFITREQCKTINGEFHKDYLCSAEELATNCGPTKDTICIEGKDEVYFVDSCGNPANIYDAGKVNDKAYWKKLVGKADSCNPNSNNANSQTCGNCDYYLGTMCKQYKANKPTHGKNICQDLNCYDTSDGKDHKHGESWCSYDGNAGQGRDAVGSRHWKHICIAGEEILEPCADYRNEVCIDDIVETTKGEFQEAACIANRWIDCLQQKEQGDCENTDQRDCRWVEGVRFIVKEGTVKKLEYGGKGACLPDYPPGLQFWEAGDSEGICRIGTTQCEVMIEDGDCEDNCECLEPEWGEKMNEICVSLGDCGGYVNIEGKYTAGGYQWKEDNDKKTLSQGAINEIKNRAGIKLLGRGAGLPWGNAFVVAVAEAVAGAIPGVLVSGQEELPGLIANREASAIESIISPTGHTASPDLFKEYTDAVSKWLTEGTETTAGAGSSAGIGAEKLSEEAAKKAAEEVAAEGGKPFAFLTSPAAKAIYNSFFAAALAYGIGQLIGGAAGFDSIQTNALSWGLASGTLTTMLLASEFVVGEGALLTSIEGTYGLFSETALLGPLGWGIVVGTIVFFVLYGEEEIKIVTFNCQPWEAPLGGQDCEKCNSEDLPCSEYRCKSLGQACELLNPGTEDEKCVWKDPKDVTSPGISPLEDALTEGHRYTDVRIRPPGSGVEPGRMRIVRENAVCLKAWMPIEFGINTTEPSQCKIDYNHTESFEDMTYDFGETNLYLYEHVQMMSWPSPEVIQKLSPELQHDGTYTLYVRCRDANGNVNEDEFAVRFCVEKGPDTTPPQIMGTSILNNMPVQYEKESLELEVYVNEPSECKWSKIDKDYESMENSMECKTEVWEMNNNLVYTCTTTLTGIEDRKDNDFFFRCKDKPDADESERNVMMESYEFTLVGTQPLTILSAEPDETIFGSTEVVTVDLEIETDNGYKNGEAVCYYSTTGDEQDYIEFFETGTNFHKQSQYLTKGAYTYYFKCVDLGGNTDETTITFDVDVDNDAPIIARAYHEENLLKIITNEDSTCSYGIQNCNFNIEDGTDMPYAEQKQHVADWRTDVNYYIRCKDNYNNQPIPNRCTMIIKPYDL